MQANANLMLFKLRNQVTSNRPAVVIRGKLAAEAVAARPPQRSIVDRPTLGPLAVGAK